MPAASLNAARKLLSRRESARRRLSGWLSVLLSAVLVAGMGVVAVVAAPVAAADPTGTGGQFVPLQARLAGVVMVAFGSSVGGAVGAAVGGGTEDQIGTYAQVGVLAGVGWWMQ